MTKLISNVYWIEVKDFAVRILLKMCSSLKQLSLSWKQFLAACKMIGLFFSILVKQIEISFLLLEVFHLTIKWLIRFKKSNLCLLALFIYEWKSGRIKCNFFFRNLDTDLLMQYGRDMHQLKLLVEAEQKVGFVSNVSWKISWIIFICIFCLVILIFFVFSFIFLFFKFKLPISHLENTWRTLAMDWHASISISSI